MMRRYSFVCAPSGADGKKERHHALFAELVAWKVDVFVT
jgi:hypothetical protein